MMAKTLVDLPSTGFMARYLCREGLNMKGKAHGTKTVPWLRRAPLKKLHFVKHTANQPQNYSFNAAKTSSV
jgi:hypothetical protein